LETTVRTIAKIVELTGGWDRLRTQPLRIEAPPMMPLSVEFLGRGPAGGMMIAISHSYEMNGDILFDPEVQVEIDPGSSSWLPVFFRQDSLGICKAAVQNVGGKVLYDHRLVEDLKAFMSFWDTNLREQGFVKAARNAVGRKPDSADQAE
jgi:hypothetical protein